MVVRIPVTCRAAVVKECIGWSYSRSFENLRILHSLVIDIGIREIKAQSIRLRAAVHAVHERRGIGIHHEAVKRIRILPVHTGVVHSLHCRVVWVRRGLVALSRGFSRVGGIFVEGTVVRRRGDFEQGEVVGRDEGLAVVLASRIQALQSVGAIIFEVAGICCAKTIVVWAACSVYWIVCSSNERAGEAGTSNAGHGLAVEASPEVSGCWFNRVAADRTYVLSLSLLFPVIVKVMRFLPSIVENRGRVTARRRRVLGWAKCRSDCLDVVSRP